MNMMRLVSIRQWQLRAPFRRYHGRVGSGCEAQRSRQAYWTLGEGCL